MIGDRAAAVRERIARAAERAGRRPDEVTLVAVSKTFPPEAVRDAFEAGLRHFGENKVQEAERKLVGLEPLRKRGARFHLVGHLQGNKARRAVQLFDLIHSLDSIELGQRLERIGAELGRPIDVLVQVDLAGEATKFGLDAKHLQPALEAFRGLKQVRARGLMVLPPLEAAEEVRPYFRRLRELGERAFRDGLLYACELSMGMSGDLEVAVEEGATIVRVGTAIFGERPPRG
ncbi:MAG TPA: YggS family pyridoxal phosphate-dependent enzyme [Vicinamibacteria bacterium]|nr:YggS family pyridoxal phosphate-dependent enzyme [Vicinamibacteria bacterium]